MEPPPVQYVTTSDGYRIAYCVCGEGRPLVLMPLLFTNVERMWTSQAQGVLYRALAARYRLVQFDPRGSGNSSRNLSEVHSLADHALDLEAVVAKLGIESFVLTAMLHFTHPALIYASRHPERLAALVLINPTPPDSAWGGLPSHFGELASTSWDLFVETFSSTFRGGGDPDYFRETTSQADFLTDMHAAEHSNVADLLPSLPVQTLVITSRASVAPGVVQAGRMIASTIPNSRLVLFDGGIGEVILSRTSEPPPAVAAIQEFLREQRDAAGTSPPTLLPLSRREVEVLRLLATGRSNAQIADELVISQNTVIRHVSNIFAKIGTENRAQAAVYARDHGIG